MRIVLSWLNGNASKRFGNYGTRGNLWSRPRSKLARTNGPQLIFIWFWNIHETIAIHFSLSLSLSHAINKNELEITILITIINTELRRKRKREWWEMVSVRGGKKRIFLSAFKGSTSCNRILCVWRIMAFPFTSIIECMSDKTALAESLPSAALLRVKRSAALVDFVHRHIFRIYTFRCNLKKREKARWRFDITRFSPGNKRQWIASRTILKKSAHSNE